MKTYHGFPERLHHRMPHWVEPGALFHIRIRLDREKQQRTLVDPSLAQAFLRDKSMSEVIRDWKRFHKRTYRVMWQEGYFDHRLRPDERGTQFSAKLN
jgi:hypothetical protein